MYTTEQRLKIYELALEKLVSKAKFENMKVREAQKHAYSICVALMMSLRDYKFPFAVLETKSFPEFFGQKPPADTITSAYWWELTHEGYEKRVTVLLNCIDQCKRSLQSITQ